MTVPGDVQAPPRAWLWGYRLLGLRLPEQYGRWVAESVATHGAVRRLGALRVVPALPLLALLAAHAVSVGRFPAGVVGGVIGVLVGTQLLVQRQRTLMLRFQRIDGTGRPVAPRGWGRLSNAGMLAVNGVLLVCAVAAYLAVVSD